MKHPQQDLIQKFSSGLLPAPISAMISAHVENCETCQNQYANEIKAQASQFESDAYSLSRQELNQSFEFIMSKIESKDVSRTSDILEKPFEVEIGGQVIPLPSSMNFLKNHPIPWKEFGKKNAIAPVVTSSKGNFYLIYIGPGESVPHHDHSGAEYSYVAAGAFNDGFSNFNSGDFCVSRTGHIHSPKATSSDGCLVVSWVEGRLNYFDGILRPLNSLLWWYLHRA